MAARSRLGQAGLGQQRGSHTQQLKVGPAGRAGGRGGEEREISWWCGQSQCAPSPGQPLRLREASPGSAPRQSLVRTATGLRHNTHTHKQRRHHTQTSENIPLTRSHLGQSNTLMLCTTMHDLYANEYLCTTTFEHHEWDHKNIPDLRQLLNFVLCQARVPYQYSPSDTHGCAGRLRPS